MPNLEEAIAFFTRVLGCELLYRTGAAFDSTGGDWMRRHYGVDERSSLRTAMLRCGPVNNVELCEWELPDAPARSAAPSNPAATGSGHLAIYVDDMRRAVEYLAAEPGVQILGSPTVISNEPNEGTEFVFVVLPWGMRLELVRWPPVMPYRTQTNARLVEPADEWTHHGSAQDGLQNGYRRP